MCTFIKNRNFNTIARESASLITKSDCNDEQ